MNIAVKMKFLLVSFMAILTLISCSTYEDGPVLSLKSKKKRLVNSWMYVTVLRNGNNVTFVDTLQNYAASSIGFNDDNRFTQIDFIGQDYITLDGDWQFSEKKDSLILTYDLGNERKILITKLKRNSFHFEELIENNLFEFDCLPNK